MLDVNVKMETTAQFRDESIAKFEVKPEPEDEEESISVNQLVWARQKSYVFWPGILLDAAEWEHKWRYLRLSKEKSRYIVFRFGYKRATYVTLSNLYDFCNEYQQFYSPLTKNKIYKVAVEDAIKVYPSSKYQSISKDLNMLTPNTKWRPDYKHSVDQLHFSSAVDYETNLLEKYLTQEKKVLSRSRIRSETKGKHETQKVRKVKPAKRKNLDVVINQPKPKCFKTMKNNQDFLPYQLIWAKYGVYPIWPGILLTEPEWVSHWKSLQKKHSPEKFVLIFWLGTCDVSYALKENVFDYCSTYDQFHNPNSKSAKYRLAIAQANSIILTLYRTNLMDTNFSSIEQHIKKFPNSTLAGVNSMVALLNVVYRFRKCSKLNLMYSTNLTNSIQCCFCFNEIANSSFIEHVSFEHFGWRFRCTKCKLIFCSKSECHDHLNLCVPVLNDDDFDNNWILVRLPKCVDSNWSQFIRMQSLESKMFTPADFTNSELDSAKQRLVDKCSACGRFFESSSDLAAHLINSVYCLQSAEVLVKEMNADC